MKAKTREDVIIWVSVAAFIVGVVMSFLGVFLPPKGELSNSMIMIIGQFLMYSAGGLGIKTYIDGRYTGTNTKNSEE